jgi:PPK2 family polyphosphate:nucleotide phosphotransferase
MVKKAKSEKTALTIRKGAAVPDSMSVKEIISFAGKLSKKFRVTDGKKFNLKDFPTRHELFNDENDGEVAEKILTQGVEALSSMQDKLYAQDKWSLLVIFQAMDAAGKDGAIKHVMSGINPQGCQVTSFKTPSAEELDHDYLWRCMKNLPERGRIGIFNRSYYEEVLVVRVHEEFLNSQKLPDKLITDRIWDERLEDIGNFEKYLNNNGLAIVKIFLNVSRKEQKRRFLERINRPEKNWKFNKSDLEERKFWKDYMKAYEELIRKTATERSPWYVVPADNKHVARIIVAGALLHAMDVMDLAYPEVGKDQSAELQRLKGILVGEK